MRNVVRLAGLFASAAVARCGDAAPDAAVPTAEIAITPQVASTPKRPREKVCERGETAPCACPDDFTGVRTCSDDGTRMRACNCEPPKPPSETGIESCDALLAYFDKLADELEACSNASMQGAADSIRQSRASMKSAFTQSVGRDERFVATMTETCAKLIHQPIPFTCP